MVGANICTRETSSIGYTTPQFPINNDVVNFVVEVPSGDSQIHSLDTLLCLKQVLARKRPFVA